MTKIVGIEIVDYVNKQNHPVKGYRVHLNKEAHNVDGYATEVIFVSDKCDIPGLKTGRTIERINYNKYGRIQDIVFAE